MTRSSILLGTHGMPVKTDCPGTTTVSEREPMEDSDLLFRGQNSDSQVKNLIRRWEQPEGDQAEM